MKGWSIFFIFIDAFFMWAMADAMFQQLAEEQYRMAALSLVGLIAWVFITNKDCKELNKQNEKKE